MGNRPSRKSNGRGNVNSAEDQVLQEEGTKSPLLFLNRLSGHGPCAAERKLHTKPGFTNPWFRNKNWKLYTFMVQHEHAPVWAKSLLQVLTQIKWKHDSFVSIRIKSGLPGKNINLFQWLPGSLDTAGRLTVTVTKERRANKTRSFLSPTF